MIMLRFTAVLTISLILHFLMYEFVWWVPHLPRPSASATDIEIVETPPPPTPEQKNLEKPIVNNTQTNEPKEMKDPAQFLAEKNQRVERQTKAKNFGVFQNANASANKNNKKAEQETKANAGKKSPANDGDMPEFAKAIQAQMSQQAQASIVPYDLPKEVEFGSATNLNADAHIYASFYNRCTELFYVRWAERLDYIFARLPLETKQQLAGRVWSTNVEIWLNADGLYEKGLVMSESGYKPFDDAGIFAFKDAKFFPNPPKAKVESDGHVRLRYRISIHM